MYLTLWTWLVGCGSGVAADCVDACDKLYAADGACHFLVPGMPEDDAVVRCEAACETAAGQDGTIGDFDPEATWETAGVREIASLNEAQLEVWAACVADGSCEELGQDAFTACGAAP